MSEGSEAGARSCTCDYSSGPKAKEGEGIKGRPVGVLLYIPAIDVDIVGAAHLLHFSTSSSLGHDLPLE